MSMETFAELGTVVRRPKLQSAFAKAGVNPDHFLATLQAEAQFVVPVPTCTSIRDEQDRPFLNLMATDPPPEYFVTGDKDFEASQYGGVPVISAAAFTRLLKHR
jgi:putative PIN family toxin of toxin-antitoxin system